jgi:hypothetical protein
MIPQYPVPLVAMDLDFDEFGPLIGRGFDADDRLMRSVADERLAWRASKRAELRRVGDRLEQARLPGAVFSRYDRESR